MNVYRREFEKGYVYVNPTATDVPSLILPQALQRLTRANLLSPLDSIPSVTSIALGSHNAAILLKTAIAPVPSPVIAPVLPAVPTGLTATAVSPTQINLTWNASTVGVTGYDVCLNDVTLATTPARSFQHTGLTPGTTYNYRVSAYDAVPNHSAWTTSISATTPPAAVGDGGGDRGGGRCFIATAAYGSPMATDVRYVRAFRDQYLLTNEPGRWFVKQYYRLSPPLADALRAHDDWRAIVRFALAPLVALSKWLVRDETFEKQTVDRP
jgi:fibronectin type III domain protein